MKRVATIEMEVDEGISDEEFEYAVQKIVNEVSRFDGFGEGKIISLDSESIEQSDEARALYEMLKQVDADDHTLSEKLEQAQEMAWRMASDEELMEEQE